MKFLTVPEVEYVAHRLAKMLMTFNEPIPEFSTRYPNVLEGCLAMPFQKFGGKSFYPSLADKAAMLFYLMIKNHPFQNGNKRVAVTTLLYLLYRNGKWLEVDKQEFYNFAKWVAESNPKVKDQTVEAVKKFIKTYITKL